MNPIADLPARTILRDNYRQFLLVAPVVIYWLLYSFFGDLQLASVRKFIGAVPIALPDLLVGLMLAGVIVRLTYPATIRRLAEQPLLTGTMAALCGYSVLSAGTGYLHGHGWYAILIDLRVVAYLAIGYLAGVVLVPGRSNATLILGLSWMALAGLVLYQGMLSMAAVRSGSAQHVVALEAIQAPLYLGKYGLFCAALGLGARLWRIPITSGAALAVGLSAAAASFVRTAWLTIAIGLASLLVFVGWTLGRRLLVVAVIGAVIVLIAGRVVPDVALIEKALQIRVSEIFVPPASSADSLATRFDESRRALAALRTPIDWTVGVGLGLGVVDERHPFLHNSFVWALANEGLIGLALFGFVVGVLPLAIGIRGLARVYGRHRLALLVLIAAHLG